MATEDPKDPAVATVVMRRSLLLELPLFPDPNPKPARPTRTCGRCSR